MKRIKPLRQTKALYHGVVEDQAELFCRFLADGTILFVNEVFSRFLGIPAAEVVGKKWHQIAVAEDILQLEAGLRSLSPTDSEVVIEKRIPAVDGRVRWVQFVNRGSFDAQGRLIELQAVGRDVSERKRIEVDLQQISERFELAVAGIADGLWDWDLTNDIVFYSPRFKELLGFAHDDPRFPNVFESFRVRLHPEDLGPTEQAIQRTVVDGQPYRASYRLRTESGDWRWFEARATTRRDAKGRATRMAGSISDITERKRAEDEIHRLKELLEQRVRQRTSELETAYESLRESEARFRAVFEQVGVGVGVINTGSGQFVRVNQRYCDITNMTSGEMLATTFMVTTHPDDLPEDLRQMELMKQGALRSFCMEKRLLRPDGSAVWVNLTVSAMWSPGDTPSHHIAVVEDITRRKRAEEEVRRFHQTLEERVHERTTQLERINAALHQSQAQLAEAQSIAGVGSYELNVLTREISWSDETYRLWGRDPNLGPVGAEEAFAALHLEDRDRIRASFDRSIARGVPLDEQARLVWPDGSLHHFHLKARAERDEQGRVSRLVGTLQDITRRKRTEAALRYSEQSLAMIFNGVSDSIWLVSVEEGECYRFRSINDSFLRVTGFTREQVLHRRIEEWFPPESLELVKAKYREVVTTGLSLQYEETTELPAGRRVGEVTVIPIPDSAGRCSTLLGTAHDITERKKAQAVLRESEEKFRALFELAPIGIAVHDASGHYLHTNRAYQKMLGYTEQELKHSGAERITHPDDVVAGQRLFAELREGARDSYQREKRYLNKEGQTIWAEASASAIRDHLGQLRFIVSMVEDITGRKRAEDQIRLLVNSVQSTHEMICITDQQNRLQFVNNAFLDACGYSEQELLGRQPDFLYSLTSAPGLCEEVYQQTLGGGWRGEVCFRRKDGTEFPIALDTSQIKDGAGRICGLLAVARDISAQKRAEKQNKAFSLLGHRLGAADTPEQAAGIILEIASELFGWDAGYVDTYSHHEDRLSSVITFDTIGGQRTNVPAQTMPTTPTPMMRHVLREGAQLINRRDELPNSVKLHAFGDTQRRSASLMFAPIRASGGSIGLLSVQSYTPWAYSGGDLKLLQALADHCGDALRRITIGQELRAADAKYRSIVDNASEGIFQIAPDGDRLLSANPALARMLGHDTREKLMVAGGGDFRRIHTRTAWWREFRRLMEHAGSVLDAEVLLHRKDGGTIWASISAHAVRDADGVVRYFEGTALDINQRKQAERQLRLQRDVSVFLSGTNELKSAATRLVDCVLLNEGIERAGLYLADEAGDALDLIAHQGLPARLVRRAARLPLKLASGGVRPRELSLSMTGLKSELQRRGFAEMEFIAIREGRRVVAVLCFCGHARTRIPARSRQAVESIAAQAAGAIVRIRTEQALQASRQMTEGMLGSLRAAVLVLDAEGNRILECNPATARIFGHRREEIIGRSVAMLHLAGEMYDQFRERLRLAAREQGAVADFEIAMVRKDNSWFPSEHSLRPLRNEAGRLVNWVNIVRDITAHKQAEQELRSVSHRIIEAQENERQRVARELHDGVNQTIASAMMRLRKVADGDAVIGPLSRERLARSVDLLAAALEENRRIARNLRPSDLDNLGFAAACRNFCRQFQSRSGLVVKHRVGRMPPRLAPLMELNLFRIIQEALTNVEKHAHAKTVRLGMGLRKKSFVLTIQDDGRGFAARSRKQPKGQGSGIGLASIQERVASLGGSCEIKSIPNRGTSIKVWIPLGV